MEERRVLRRLYLTAALDQLVAEGKIRHMSRAHVIVRKVIAGGAAVLSDHDRALYDFELIPLIESTTLH
jgi:hypothetical protein